MISDCFPLILDQQKANTSKFFIKDGTSTHVCVVFRCLNVSQPPGVLKLLILPIPTM